MIQVIIDSGAKIPINFLCKHFGVSPSGFYFWRKREHGVRFVKKLTSILNRVKAPMGLQEFMMI